MTDNTPNSDKIPYGYCQCGCGQRTKIAASTNSRYGHVKGEPYRFLYGHFSRTVKRAPADRFWESVDKGKSGECWEWQALRRPDGYGHFQVGNKKYRAHRYSWKLHNGPIPKGLHVLHKCDNPPCVNPSHLFLGDDAANMRDKTKKGRAGRPYGKRAGHRHITNAQAKKFREEYPQSGMSIRQFASMHGINRSTMRNIVRRITYKDI